MTKTLISLALAATLAGCAAQQGPDDESLTDRIADRQRDYCTETSPVALAAALAVIRAKVPGYPASGLCTDAEAALADEINRRLEDLPEGATIDIEQAVQDQQRFEAE